MKSFYIGLSLVVLAAITVAVYWISLEPTLTAPATAPTPVPVLTPEPTAEKHSVPTVTTATAPAAAKQVRQNKPTFPTHALFKEPVEPQVFELASGALVIWRNLADQKPALVLFSVHPFLEPLPESERKSIRNFVRTASPAELVRRGRFNVPDTAFVPPQTVSAAIASGLIGELIFVLPTTRTVDQVSLPSFQQKAFAAGFLSEKETLALKLQDDGVISGRVRGIPFRCVHPDALPSISRPVIIHVDLSYFKDLYVNDVKTPLYNLIFQTAQSIRNAGWKSLAATLSYSNQEAEFSLETRYLISNLATLLLHPDLLESNPPLSWQLRADASLANATFAEETAQELIAQAVEVAPDDPDALYALSLQKFQQKQPDEAFALLDRAVAIDPGYALAYLDLAETGIELGQVKKAEELFNKAASIFPHNPFIRIKLAHLLIEGNRGTEAIPLLRELQQLPWSSTYHPETTRLLKQMLDYATGQAK